MTEIEVVTVHDQGKEKGGIVTFSVKGFEAETVSRELNKQKINTSTTSPNNARYDLAHRGVPGVVRASTHYYNTQEEIDSFISAVNELSSN